MCRNGLFVRNAFKLIWETPFRYLKMQLMFYLLASIMNGVIEVQVLWLFTTITLCSHVSYD